MNIIDYSPYLLYFLLIHIIPILLNLTTLNTPNILSRLMFALLPSTFSLMDLPHPLNGLSLCLAHAFLQ